MQGKKSTVPSSREAHIWQSLSSVPGQQSDFRVINSLIFTLYKTSSTSLCKKFTNPLWVKYSKNLLETHWQLMLYFLWIVNVICKVSKKCIFYSNREQCAKLWISGNRVSLLLCIWGDSICGSKAVWRAMSYLSSEQKYYTSSRTELDRHCHIRTFPAPIKGSPASKS